MALRPRSQRSCKGGKEWAATSWSEVSKPPAETHHHHAPNPSRGCARKRRLTSTLALEHQRAALNLASALYTKAQPFPFFELPIELRDQVYSYLVIAKDSCRDPVLDALAIQHNRKKRQSAEIARNRLNQKRIAAGKPATITRSVKKEPILDLNILCASKKLHAEGSRHFYNNNWFALSLTKLPSTTFEAPHGWNFSRIMRLDLNLQLKDALRMDRHIDWPTFFSMFPALRFLRILPTFHPRYYEWAHEELHDWKSMSYIHKAFFGELFASIPSHVALQWSGTLDVRRWAVVRDDLLFNHNLLEDIHANLICLKKKA